MELVSGKHFKRISRMVHDKAATLLAVWGTTKEKMYLINILKKDRCVTLLKRLQAQLKNNYFMDTISSDLTQ